MRTGTLLALLLALAALCLAGCGGGGEAPPPVENTSSIRGEVEIQGAVADYEVLLDGQPVPGALRADGTYSIENVPPGEHRVAIIARDGMEGGYATVEVRPGERAQAPRIVTEIGGQIVGIVTVIEDGLLHPLAGVEVTAQPAVMIMADRGAAEQDTPVSDGAPLIYPPPGDLPSFSTFTDPEGSFMIRAVPPGEYTVSVAQPSMQNTWQWVWVEAGHTAVADFTLRPAIEPGVGTVRGRVTGTQGGLAAPVMGARVTIVSDTWWGPSGPPETPPAPAPLGDGGEEGSDGGGSEPGVPMPPEPDLIAPPYFDSVSTLTSANGEYTLNAPAGYASIEVYAPGWAAVWQAITVLPGETLTLDFELDEVEDWPPEPPDGVIEEPPSPPALDGEQPPAPPVGEIG